MNNSVKIALYVVLTILASVSGWFALRSFGHLMNRGDERISRLEQIENEPVANTNISNVTLSNSAATTGRVVTATQTNTSTQVTNQVEAEIPTALGTAHGEAIKPKGSGRIGLWTALFVVSLIALGLLIASDVSHFIGNRALKTLYNEEGEGVANPEYEKAEEAWANGKHLEAISLMREYLTQNPREQHVAMRIAEIYEKDLGNHLAAALEYEEVLKHKLPDERWGWSAIHLCNLYFKLGQEQKAYPLLRRIVDEYPNVAAAEKARKRLEQVGDMAPAEMLSETEVTPKPKPVTASGPALPPGFRPKK